MPKTFSSEEERNSARKAAQKKYKDRTKEQRKQLNFRNALRRKYGITEGEYWERRYMQGDSCPICGFFFDEEHLPVVDHCHENKWVRGILCWKCNVALGLFKEDKTSLANAIRYLSGGEHAWFMG